MKRRHLSMAVGIPAALVFACATHAQQTPPRPMPPQSRPMQQTQPSQQTVPTSAQTMQCAAGSNCYDNNTTDRDTGRASRTAPKFSTLAGAKGYVTRTDTSGHRWWARHFRRCDSNHDGKLTRSEYNTCRTQH